MTCRISLWMRCLGSLPPGPTCSATSCSWDRQAPSAQGALFCRGVVRKDSGEQGGGQGRKRGWGREELSAASREASAIPREDPKDELVLPNCPNGDSQDFQLPHCRVGIWVAHHSFHQKAFFYFVPQEECHHQQRQRMTPGWTHRIKGES